MIPGDAVLVDGQKRATFVREISRHHSEIRLPVDPPDVTRTITTERLSPVSEAPVDSVGDTR